MPIPKQVDRTSKWWRIDLILFLASLPIWFFQDMNGCVLWLSPVGSFAIVSSIGGLGIAAAAYTWQIDRKKWIVCSVFILYFAVLWIAAVNEIRHELLH
jgi:hypothetical protein